MQKGLGNGFRLSAWPLPGLVGRLGTQFSLVSAGGAGSTDGRSPGGQWGRRENRCLGLLITWDVCALAFWGVRSTHEGALARARRAGDDFCCAPSAVSFSLFLCSFSLLVTVPSPFLGVYVFSISLCSFVLPSLSLLLPSRIAPWCSWFLSQRLITCFPDVA